MATQTAKRSQLLTIAACLLTGVALLAARHSILGDTTPAETAENLQVAIGGVGKHGNPQLEQGKNLLSRQIEARATFLIAKAREQDDAREWLDQHRGSVLFNLSEADKRRGGIWTGEASDNDTAPLIYETLAVELAMLWLTDGDYSPRESYGMTDYLMASRLAGEIDSFDSSATLLYLQALDLAGLPQDDAETTADQEVQNAGDE